MYDKKIIKVLNKKLKKDGFKNHKKILKIFKKATLEHIKGGHDKVIYIVNELIPISSSYSELTNFDKVVRIEIGDLKQDVQQLKHKDLEILAGFFNMVGLRVILKVEIQKQEGNNEN